MIFFLLFLLACSTIAAYCLFDRDVFSPIVVVNATFFLCAALAALHTNTWNLPMHFNTVLVILSGIMFFGLGAYLAKFAYRGCKIPERAALPFRVHAHWGVCLLVAACILFFAYLNLQEFQYMAQRYTGSYEISDMLIAFNQHLAFGDIRFSSGYLVRLVLGQAAAYVFLFAFLYRGIYESKLDVFLLLPAMAYIPLLLATSGRQEILYLALMTVISAGLLYQYRYGFAGAYKKKMYAIGLGAGVFFIAAFVGLGLLSGKIQPSMQISRVIAHYAGTNISALDVFVNRMAIVENDHYGEMTLTGVYSALQRLGVPAPANQAYIKEFVEFDGINTNVYTAFRRYIQDYGYVGCSLVMLLLGALYSGAYMFLKYRNRSPLWMLLYASYAYPMFLFCREECFMANIFSARGVLTISAMILLCQGVMKKDEAGEI